MGMNISRGKVNLPYRVVLYGVEGIGKSTFAAQFPEPLFSDTEGSTLRMDVPRFDPRPETWALLTQQAEFVRDNPAVCRTYVIDTADWAEKLCQKAVCDRAKKEGIEDFGYGKGYVYTSEEFGMLLNILNEIHQKGIHVVLTAHAALRKFEQPDEMGAYDRWEMKLHKLIGSMLKEWADLVLFANYKTYVVAVDDQGKKHKAQGGKQRVMYTTHSSAWDAKNRDGLADELPFDFGQIAHLFTGGAPATQTAPEPAPAPTVVQTVTAHPAPAEQPAAEPRSEAWDGIPSQLLTLMEANDVQPEEIMYIVSDQKGYYPQGTPIRNYAEDFIQGWCIGMWDKVLETVKKNREETPF